MNKFYVYEWFIVESLEIFYVGKGFGKRRFRTSQRNIHFTNIIKKYNCAVKLHASYLSEDEAFKIEKDRILELKSKGLAKANYHNGGEGGVTGPRTQEFKDKMSKIRKGRFKGKDNPNYGNGNKIKGDLNGRATKVILLKDNVIIKTFSCKKELYEWKNNLPKPNGAKIIREYLQGKREMKNGYKLIEE